ncbi:MAG: hypothetical protein JKY64_03705 [Alcanivorax sp.]|nr:hypothetical protein [Alcanivorax sp.]
MDAEGKWGAFGLITVEGMPHLVGGGMKEYSFLIVLGALSFAVISRLRERKPKMSLRMALVPIKIITRFGQGCSLLNL